MRSRATAGRARRGRPTRVGHDARPREVRRGDEVSVVDDVGDDDEAPAPLAHAAPDVELAEAQLALGRPELASDRVELDDDFELEAEDGEDGGGTQGPPGGGAGGELPVPAGGGPAGRGAVAERRGYPGHRLINFLQGSWRELQRVQWPDRRQVMQATGVVIGFVIVAGVFLGVADFVAGKLVNYILK